jgi:UDP-N-acetylglucosamine 3-dehydrogenase
MTEFKAVMIGCGKPGGTEGATGSGMSHAHVRGYQALPGVTVVGCADLVEERAKDFAKLHNISDFYTDFEKMIKKEKPDIVSISTWPDSHRKIAERCADLGVRAIHCEKPMATTLGDSRAMKEYCEKKGVQLTFNHQRRFEPQYQMVRKLAAEGAVGEVRRIEVGCGNLYDWGTHWFDMMNFYNNDVPAEWLLGQIHVDSPSEVFGVRMENMGMAHIKFANGVYGLMLSGPQPIWADHRIIGSEGIIEAEMPVIRVRSKGDKKMRTIEFPEKENIGEWTAITWGIRDALHCLDTGREPELSARKAFQATEFIFGTYESARRRGRVEFPLNDIDDNPLHTMLDKGQIGPKA